MKHTCSDPAEGTYAVYRKIATYKCDGESDTELTRLVVGFVDEYPARAFVAEMERKSPDADYKIITKKDGDPVVVYNGKRGVV